MTQANVADLKSHLSEYLSKVQSGESIEICKRNTPVAVLMPIAKATVNRTQLGCGKGSVTVHGDLTEPVLDGWDMHSEDLV